VSWDGETFECEEFESKWVWKKEGDESILATKFDGTVYKFDRNRGLTKETLIEDYAVSLLRKSGEWDDNADWAVNIFNLTVKDHVDTMKVFAKYIDSAMSKTINIPNDYPYEDFKSLYMDMYNSGVIKGGTTYRDGTMTSVVSASSTDMDSKEDNIPKTIAPKRPKELDCDVHHLTVHGEKWVVFVGLLNDEPYEVFAGKMENVCLSKKITTGKLIKYSRGKYGFIHDDIVDIRDINAVFENSAQSAITRLTSLSLRHGAEIKYIISQLQKTGNGLTTFAKSIARTLKKYVKEGEVLDDLVCPECSSKGSMIMSEGCNKCQNCGYSACA
jgi:ribonucleoside-diphosphate reductase alpha chain